MKREVEKKGVIPDSQVGLKKGRGTRRRENVCVYERERRINKWLVRKTEEKYSRTKNKVKVKEKNVNGLKRQME
jgi:hypothetical protein